jgi:hypothetical protein
VGIWPPRRTDPAPPERQVDMGADLSTSWLGIRLKNPLVLAASPLTAEIHKIEQFVDAGVSAAVLTSLFAEQVDENGVCDATAALAPGKVR